MTLEKGGRRFVDAKLREGLYTISDKSNNPVRYYLNLLFTSQTILGIEPDRSVRSSVYTAAKYLPVQRACNGNSLITGHTIWKARQNSNQKRRQPMVVFVFKKVEKLI